ncbi:transcriptional repressor TCF25-domain-containing protein [Paraphysoderma sedebokerense]|nr:transcriptional repressor TCF25-domain-containing protein [Paraphysoderma sedebokerense]
MSGRAYRRLLKEKELENLQPQESESEQESDDGTSRPQQNLFDLLNAGTGEAEDDNEEEESQNELEEEEAEVVKQRQRQPSSKKQQKKGKKKKGKEKGKLKESESKVDDDISWEELEKTLQEIGDQYEKPSNDSETNNSPQKYVLNIDTRQMDPDAELRRLFGSKIVNEVANKRNKRIIRKTILSTPRDTWPRLDSLGLSMELVESKDGHNWFSFTHNLRYQEIQCRFLECVATFDPNTIANLLHMYPSHIDSLLQMSEVCKHSGDIEMAAQFIERALFMFERSMHPLFNIATEDSSSPYSEGFNSYRGMAAGEQHSSFQNFCLDPLSCLSMIDFYAVKAGQSAWLLELWNELSNSAKLHSKPNWLYSVALAKFHLESSKKSAQEGSSAAVSKTIQKSATELLCAAICTFPTVLPALYKKNSLHLDARVSNHPYFQQNPKYSILDGLVELYVERSAPLWKEPEVVEWVNKNLPLALQTVENRSDPHVTKSYEVREEFYTADRLSRNVYRHIVISDIQTLNAYIPPELRSSINLHDPLPPPGVPNPYAEFQQTLRARGMFNSFIPSNAHPLAALMRSLMPWANNVEDTGELVNESRGGGVVDGNGQLTLEEAMNRLPSNVRSAIQNMGLAGFLGLRDEDLAQTAGERNSQAGGDENESDDENNE